MEAIKQDGHVLEKEEEFKHLIARKEQAPQARPKERKAKRRRKAEELGPNERWNCPFGCGKFYRKTSTLSVKRHKQECPQRLMVTLIPQYRHGAPGLLGGVNPPIPTLAQLIPPTTNSLTPSPTSPLNLSDLEISKKSIASSASSSHPRSPMMAEGLFHPSLSLMKSPSPSHLLQQQAQVAQQQAQQRQHQQQQLLSGGPTTVDYSLDELEYDIAAARARALSLSFLSLPSSHQNYPSSPLVNSSYADTIKCEDSKNEIVSTLPSLASRDSWICPLRCGTWFRASSSLVAKHLAQCPNRRGSGFLPPSASFPGLSAPGSPTSPHFPSHSHSSSFAFSRSQSLPPSPTADSFASSFTQPLQASSTSNNLLDNSQLYLHNLQGRQHAIHAAATAAYINASLSAPCSPVSSRVSSPSQLQPLLQRISIGNNYVSDHSPLPSSRSFTLTSSSTISSSAPTSSSSGPSLSSAFSGGTSSRPTSPTSRPRRVRRQSTVSAPYLRKSSSSLSSRSPGRNGMGGGMGGGSGSSSQPPSPPLRYRRYSEPLSAPGVYPSLDSELDTPPAYSQTPRLPHTHPTRQPIFRHQTYHPSSTSHMLTENNPTVKIEFQDQQPTTPLPPLESKDGPVSSPISTSSCPSPSHSIPSATTHLPSLTSLHETIENIELIDDPMMKISPKSTQELFNILGSVPTSSFPSSNLSPPTLSSPSTLNPFTVLQQLSHDLQQTSNNHTRNDPSTFFCNEDDWHGPEPIIKSETDDLDLSSLDGSVSPFHDLGLPHSSPSSPGSPGIPLAPMSNSTSQLPSQHNPLPSHHPYPIHRRSSIPSSPRGSVQSPTGSGIFDLRNSQSSNFSTSYLDGPRHSISSNGSSGIFDSPPPIHSPSEHNQSSFISTRTASPVSSVTSTTESTPNTSGIYQEPHSPRTLSITGLYNLFTPLERSTSDSLISVHQTSHQPNLLPLNEDSLLDTEMTDAHMSSHQPSRPIRDRNIGSLRPLYAPPSSTVHISPSTSSSTSSPQKIV